MTKNYQYLDIVLHGHRNQYEHPNQKLILLVHWTFLHRDFNPVKNKEVRINCLFHLINFFLYSLIKLWMK